MDVGGRATQDAKAEDFAALRDFARERRYLGVRSTEQNSLERQRTSEIGSTLMKYPG